MESPGTTHRSRHVAAPALDAQPPPAGDRRLLLHPMRFVLPFPPRPTTTSRSSAVRAAGLAVLLAVAASCGTGETPQSDGSAAGGGAAADESVTIAIGFTEEVDPDVFFDLELGSVTNAVYDTLLRYEPG